MNEIINEVGTETMEIAEEAVETVVDTTTPAGRSFKKFGIAALAAMGIGATYAILKKKGVFERFMIKKLEKKGYSVTKPISVEFGEVVDCDYEEEN